MSRTDAHRKADAKYREKRVRVALDLDVGGEDLARLERLAKTYGSRKAAIIAGLKKLDEN